MRTKFFLSVLIAVLAWGIAGCGQQAVLAEEENSLQIVCTIFPAYDWVREIVGEEEAELTLLMKNGADLHSYQPTVWDMQKIAEADLFVYVGGESDFWVEAALQNSRNPKQKVLNLMEVLGDAVKEEEHVEGMHAEEEHEEEEAHEADEHIWLSLNNASLACEAVAEALGGLNEAQKTIYQENAVKYQKKLTALDRAYQDAVKKASTTVLLFGDRFPFRYLTEDYGLTYYAAFAGCSAETEASFETIAFLAEKTGELHLPAVMTIDGSDGKIARTIAGNTKTRDQKVLLLDSMQSVSTQEIEEGVSYLSIMEQNLQVLREALGVSKGA